MDEGNGIGDHGAGYFGDAMIFEEMAHDDSLHGLGECAHGGEVDAALGVEGMGFFEEPRLAGAEVGGAFALAKEGGCDIALHHFIEQGNDLIAESITGANGVGIGGVLAPWEAVVGEELP